MTLSETCCLAFIGFLSHTLASSATTSILAPSSSIPIQSTPTTSNPNSIQTSDSITDSITASMISSTLETSSSSLSQSSIMTISPANTTVMTTSLVSTAVMTTIPEMTSTTTPTPTVPEKPMNFRIRNLTTTNVTFIWKAASGAINYTIRMYEQSDRSDFNVTTGYINITITDNNTDTYTVHNLTSFWNYTATIQAENTAGSSPPAEIVTFQTKASAPGQVENITVTKGDGNLTVACVMWNCLRERDQHGNITGYILTYSGSAKNVTHACDTKHNIFVKPGLTYQVCVEAESHADCRSKKTCVSYTAPEGSPSSDSLSKSNLKLVSVGETTISLSITSPQYLIENTNGKIVFVGIFVCKDGHERCKAGWIKQKKINDVKKLKWSEAKQFDFGSPYRVTKSNWNQELENQTSWEIVVGEDKACPNEPSDKACNGPLQEDTAYKVMLASCTNKGCTSVKVDIYKTVKKKDYTVPIVVTLVVLLLVLAAVVAGIFLYRRYYKGKPKKKKMVNRPVLLRNFGAHLKNMRRDEDRLFLMDFEAIRENCPDHPCLAAAKDNNKAKNRYDNILPYDRSRVFLKEIYNDEDTNYINANYVPGCDFEKEFISTQGPLTNTINDFWRMVWEQDISTIVMLSDFHENGIPKVQKYYEDLNTVGQYGNIQVTLKEISYKRVNNYPNSLFRIQTFQISMDDEVRTVRHFFLKGWRDFSADLKPGVIIEFIDNVRKSVNTVKSKPIIVHCSAGVGRSGTFIALDIMQKYIRQSNMDHVIDIPDLVMRLRNYRCLMVQSLAQYIFVHDVVNLMIERKERMENGVLDTDVDGSVDVTIDEPDLLPSGLNLSYTSSESESQEDQDNFKKENQSQSLISEEEIKKSVDNFNFLSKEDDGEKKESVIKAGEMEMSSTIVENGLDNKAFECETDVDNKQATPDDVKVEINE